MSRRIQIIKKGEEYAPFYAIVDDEDFELVGQFTWSIAERGRKTKTLYAMRNVGPRHGVEGPAMVHGLITGNDRTDHINSIGLDNRRVNLRDCSQSQNGGNARKTSNPTTSQYKGVSWDDERGKWAAKVFKDGKRYWLGRFDTEVDAAMAYDEKARELFGEFARPNFPENK